ncbi:transcriptional regulator [Mucilaginibacter sp. PPCGB 2223]|uniref:helix-turn-helix and ligand-binding sensor domain-containing protein n=1 Tax=Mucilaginibacter sp. PPCGB 2223 TaxID=1886027 RepID=UPI00082542F0|nr:triple tyrosine motif-containing protein [Mucilaginibacter sp. PPCGB 2223]OCX51938.1 transcriptional regulator [Mucilaginibacter sp. PPCGB 2223]
MIKIFRWYQGILVLICFFQWAAAADIKSIGVPYVRNYSKYIYQSGNQNWSQTKDENGVMYFGNSEGLLSFDGRYWQQYHLPNRLIVRAVASDGHGKIYTGAFGEIGYWSENKTGVLVYHSLSKLIPAKYALNEEVWKIYIDNGQIIFQTFGTVYIYKNGAITAVKSPNPYLFLFRANHHYFVEQINAGLFELVEGKLTLIKGSDILKTGILTILPFGNNRFLIGTAKNGLYVYDGQKIYPFKNQADDFLRKYQLNNGVFIPGKYYAFGTILNGVIIIDTAGNIVQHINKLSGLQNNTVLSLYLDDEQNLWAGLDNGIDCIEINSPLYFYFDKGGKFGTVYASIVKNNKIYLGTNQGLFYSEWYPQNKNQLLQSFDFKLIPGSQGQVWDLSLIDNKLLCGHNEGTYQVDDDRITKISAISGGWIIKKLNETHLIQGTYTGLVIYDKDQKGDWKFGHKVEGFGQPSRYIESDNKQIWVSHAYKGIYKIVLNDELTKALSVKYYDKNSGLPDSYNINVFNLNGKIVFSSDEGFYVYDNITDRFYTYQQLNKSLGSFAASNKIIPALNKKSWFINHGHVAIADFSIEGRLRLNTNWLSPLNERMVQSYENISRINDKIYLISVDDGFAIFNDDDVSTQPRGILPSVLIRKVEDISDKPVAISNNNQQVLSIPYSINSIRVTYSLPYYVQSKIRFQYFLEGYSTEWSNWSAQTQREFANLPQGNYIFKVRGQIDDTRQTGITELKFIILPPWYASKLAFLLYGILLILLYYLIRYYYRRKLAKHQKHIHDKLQKEKEEALKQEAIANEQLIVNIKNEQLQADLESKSRELANSAMNIVYKNELLQKLRTEIIELKDAAGKKLAPEQLKHIQRVIDEGMTDERDWNVFETSFNGAHENFFKKLKADHPDLVPNDLKLCAYLRMNMSSKEIASLLNISLRGVEIRRYRLRKKLDLPHDKNLSEFLLEL